MKSLLFLLIPVLLLSQIVENPDSVTTSIEKQNVSTIFGQDDSFSHFSFGAYYTPSAKLYRVYYYMDYGDLSLLYTEYDVSKMEAQLAYKFTRQLGITFELGFISNYSKAHYEEHQTNTYDTYDDGYKREESTKTFNIAINMKYYLLPLSKYKVSPFLVLGFGKQYTKFTDNYEDLYNESTSSAIIEENYDDFMSKINSPYMFNAAFGVEYFFTESLSLYSMLELTYLTASAEYKYKRIYTSNYNSVSRRSEKMDMSYSRTDVGIGLNFYF